ncbi:MAG: hypothetical protein DRQ78_00045 [Epsilonproteobacteria bacterium]|nr:MAG: hypothetical protein DRQ78_00045 [Campylobacterota bacterium]
MAYFPWKNGASIPVSDSVKTTRGIPDGVGLNGSIWPRSINNGESPPPIDESRWGEKTLCISMHSLVNNIGSNILHVTPFKMLRSNIARQPYDIMSSTAVDGLSTPRDGWNSNDPEVGDKFQADTTNACIINDKIFVSTNDSLIYKLYNLGSDTEPEFIILEIIDPAELYPTINRTSTLRGLDNSISKIWLCESINNYLFILFVNKLFILEYDIEASLSYTIRYDGFIPYINTKYAFSTSDNSSPLSPGRYIDGSREIPEYNDFIGWKDQAFVDGYDYDATRTSHRYNPIAYNNDLISPKWMGDPSSGFFIMYNTSSSIIEYGSTPWPLTWDICEFIPGGEYGGSYGRISTLNIESEPSLKESSPREGPSIQVISSGSDYDRLRTNYRLISIGWNSAGEPWPFMTTSARNGSIGFAGTVIPRVELKDWKISNNAVEQVINVKITGDSSVIEGQMANYTVSITDENDQPYIPINNVTVYIGYFLGENTEESDLSNPLPQMTIVGGSNTGSFVLNTNDQDDQLDLNRSVDVTVLDIQRDEFQLVYIDTNPVHTTIEDSEVKPIIEFLIDSQDTIEQITTLQVTIVANIAPTEQDILVPFLTTGTANESADYTKSHTDFAVLPIGANSITISVDIISDTYIEPHKEIIFTLGDPQYATLGSKVQHVITIFGEESVSLEEAAGPTTLIFSNYSSNLFWGRIGVGNNSPSAISSPVLAEYNSASLDTEVTGPGRLTFDWKNTSNAIVRLSVVEVENQENYAQIKTMYPNTPDWESSSHYLFTDTALIMAWDMNAESEIVGDGFLIDNIFWTPTAQLDLSSAVSETGYTFASSGDTMFTGQDTMFSPNEGSVSAAAIIPPPPLDSTTVMSTSVTLTSPNTTLSFEFALIDVYYYDQLLLYIDGYYREEYSVNYGYNENELHTVTYEAYDGPHVIEWRFKKKTSTNYKNATVVIDNVKFIGS